jgi:hypothetical protein
MQIGIKAQPFWEPPKPHPSSTGVRLTDTPEPETAVDVEYECPTQHTSGLKDSFYEPLSAQSTEGKVSALIQSYGWKGAAKRLHPDTGGTHEEMIAFNILKERYRECQS